MKHPALKFIVVGANLLLAAACTPDAPRSAADPLSIEVGTRAHIKRHGQDFKAVVTAVKDKLVTMEIRFKDEVLLERHYYRGLYPIAGTDEGRRFEVEFDEARLEALFPLEAGKSSSFEGIIRLIDEGESLNITVTAHVEKKKAITLDTGPEDVFVIHFTTDYENDQLSGRSTRNTVHYSPKHAMVLKSIIYKNDTQSFWQVVRIDKEDTAPRLRRRRAGTVAI